MAALSHRADLKAAGETLAAIEAAVNANTDTLPRQHLGMSQIGRPCDRELWFGFRWAKQKEWGSRMLRLFARGQREEAVFVQLLRDAGIEVHEVDPETGRQYRASLIGGHFGGSQDGRVMGLPESPKTPHVAEFKTHNDKSFQALKRDGVRKAKPEHFTQMQCYMGTSDLTRALYLAVNKDTDELYAERIEFDAAEFERAIKRAERIIRADAPPAGISDDPSWFQCKFCDVADLCHRAAVPDVNCRTCAHATPVMDGLGGWECARNKGECIPLEFQRTGCPDHVFIPALLANWATAIDADEREGWIEYARKSDDKQFRNGPMFLPSAELRARGGM
jgi:hypothetical protein